MDRAQAALDRAFNHDEDLLLLYQPIHRIDGGEIVAAEALLRQRRSSGEIRNATIIARAAERAGGEDLFALDSLLARRATEDAARWQEQARVSLNFNISPREFDRPDFAHRLGALLTNARLDERLVNLEVTETSRTARPEEMSGILDKLKQRGLCIWLDDFGSGHSSISQLARFPVDGLKIAGEFVEPLATDRRCRAIVRAMIRLAHDLGMEVTAEEVEREEQLELLREWDCDFVQGFLFSRPMTPEQLTEKLTPPSESASPRERSDRGASRDPSSRFS